MSTNGVVKGEKEKGSGGKYGPFVLKRKRNMCDTRTHTNIPSVLGLFAPSKTFCENVFDCWKSSLFLLAKCYMKFDSKILLLRFFSPFSFFFSLKAFIADFFFSLSERNNAVISFKLFFFV